MEVIRIFAGFDRREEVGFHTFVSSVIHGTSLPVAVMPLVKERLERCGIKIADGSNAFTYSRFLVPFICGFAGWAIFVDGSDMVARGDLTELWTLRDPSKAVQVVKHDYLTRHPRKYCGTPMECDNRDYERKQWAAVMLINCAHLAWSGMTPELVAAAKPLDLLQLRFLEEYEIGELPAEWNWLCDEQGANEAGKILHWTAGIPAIPHYAEGPQAAAWFASSRRMMSATAGA